MLTLGLPGLAYPSCSGVTSGLQTHLKIIYDSGRVCVCVANVLNMSLGSAGKQNKKRNIWESKFYTDKWSLYCMK